MSILLTLELRQKLLHNNATARDTDHVPVVKWFAPWGAATWLLTEMEQDGDICFGLCDLGLGEPELGYVSLREVMSVEGPYELKIERDLHFHTDKPLSEWFKAARADRRIVQI
ncbi:DUF2958 domain-containing protein [Agrobacterium tumefaciens]|jgi:hypothetical protein|uniref:DUF2958 domain-containing protein n=1 Tax=Agrobacterium tumefaciens TaxID=358 RepID=UPI000DD09353|nr:DUF2958 domain-containing protein [Agrobacterium tumefaciens]UXT83567.1 DUF2958 domain-containing protein [Agrobacterium tumefaciens]